MQTRSDKTRARSETAETRKAARPDDAEQSRRFVEAAKAAEADETPKGAEKAFKAVVKPRKPKG
jgi:hypothetical protein